MKWRTEVEIPKGPRLVGYADSAVVLGSCFAGHLGEKLAYYQFRHLANPFGVIFHPVPMERLLGRAASGGSFVPEDLFRHEDRYRSLEVHSRLSRRSQEKALDAMNRALDSTRESISGASHVVLTLGTAFAFRHKEEGRLVANCHKLPGGLFARELTPVPGLVQSLEGIVSLILGMNSRSHILFTVSPVRHLRDGLVENQRSKAHLLAATHQVVDGRQVHYFPSYELLMDDLRDYRFYDRDLVHPSPQAVDYVWERFVETWVDPAARPLMERVAAVRKQLGHRSMDGGAPEGMATREAALKKAEALASEYPFMQFDL